MKIVLAVNNLKRYKTCSVGLNFIDLMLINDYYDSIKNYERKFFNSKKAISYLQGLDLGYLIFSN